MQALWIFALVSFCFSLAFMVRALVRFGMNPPPIEYVPEHIVLPPAIFQDKAMRDRFNDENPSSWNSLSRERAKKAWVN